MKSEEHGPACMVLLAYLRTLVCELLICFVCFKSKLKERRRFSSFLSGACASCRPARESQAPEQKPGMDVRRALCVVKDLWGIDPEVT